MTKIWQQTTRRCYTSTALDLWSAAIPSKSEWSCLDNPAFPASYKCKISSYCVKLDNIDTSDGLTMETVIMLVWEKSHTMATQLQIHTRMIFFAVCQQSIHLVCVKIHRCTRLPRLSINEHPQPFQPGSQFLHLLFRWKLRRPFALNSSVLQFWSCRFPRLLSRYKHIFWRKKEKQKKEKGVPLSGYESWHSMSGGRKQCHWCQGESICHF